MSDNERAARLAGIPLHMQHFDARLINADYPDRCYRCLVHKKQWSAITCSPISPPDYENSIDAQIRDLDPLVEARY